MAATAPAFWDSYEKNYRIRDPTFIQTIKDHKHIILPKKRDKRFIFHESVQVSKTYKYKLFPLKCIICIVENKFWCLFQGILSIYKYDICKVGQGIIRISTMYYIKY